MDEIWFRITLAAFALAILVVLTPIIVRKWRNWK